MENYLLKEMITSFRKGEIKAFAEIYEEYKNLITMYSKRIGDEDSYQELTVFLLETLYSIELSKFPQDKSDTLKRYIAVCLKNKYIALSRKKQSDTRRLIMLYPDDGFYSEIPDSIYIKDMLKVLSSKQQRIIIYRYIYGYSDAEISNALRISRQAVNRLKNRGLRTLRENYTGW